MKSLNLPLLTWPKKSQTTHRNDSQTTPGPTICVTMRGQRQPRPASSTPPAAGKRRTSSASSWLLIRTGPVHPRANAPFLPAHSGAFEGECAFRGGVAAGCSSLELAEIVHVFCVPDFEDFDQHRQADDRLGGG